MPSIILPNFASDEMKTAVLTAYYAKHTKYGGLAMFQRLEGGPPGCCGKGLTKLLPSSSKTHEVSQRCCYETSPTSVVVRELLIPLAL